MLFYAWLCLLKINIAKCFGKWLFNCLVIILLCFYVYNGTFSFHLIMGQLINLYFFHAVVFWLFDSTLVSALEECMSIVTEIWGILLLGITSCLISNRFQDAGAVIQCCSEDVICSKWHPRPWSGTWFRAQFLNNRLGIVQNGSKPTSKMAPFTPNCGSFQNFWTNVEKSFLKQTWFCQIWCWSFSG